MEKVFEDVGDDDDFKSAAWVSATNYVNAFGGTITGFLGDVDNFLKKGKLEQIIGIVKSCSPNMLGDLNVTLKDLLGAAMILKNVSVFTPKPSKHYLTMQNVVEVFRKDTVPGSGSG
nr:transposase, MuDR, MULE transposase domain protein [Tanacetum cinerariifolium]